jgi:hypothetical protein
MSGAYELLRACGVSGVCIFWIDYRAAGPYDKALNQSSGSRAIPIGLSRIFSRWESALARETATLAFFTGEKGGTYGSQRNQEMRASGL